MNNTSGWLSLVGKLEFRPFIRPPISSQPTEKDIEEIANSAGREMARNILEGYFFESSEYLSKCGIRAGCVLQLRSGGYLLVGHISEHLAFVDDEPFVELDDIIGLAYLY